MLIYMTSMKPGHRYSSLVYHSLDLEELMFKLEILVLVNGGRLVRPLRTAACRSPNIVLESSYQNLKSYAQYGVNPHSGSQVTRPPCLLWLSGMAR